MKTIYLTLITLLLSISINAQQKINPETSLEIPIEFKSKEIYSIDKLHTYTIETRYFKEIKGYVTVTFDINGNVLSINAPNSVVKNLFTTTDSSNKTEGVPHGFKECSEYCKGSFWCTVACVFAGL